MNNENYFVIYGWMINKLNLEGSELITFAFIYGFNNGFEGSIKYIADSIGIKERMARYAIDSLVKKNLIVKQRRAGKTSKYSVAKIAEHIGKNCLTSVAKIATNNNTHTNIYKLNSKQSSFNNFNQRSYNYSELENILRSN